MFLNSTVNHTLPGEDASLKVTEVNKRDNWLELKIDIKDTAECTSSRESEHKINTSLAICIKVLFTNKQPKQQQKTKPSLFADASTYNVNRSEILVLFKFVKTEIDDDTIYSVTCNSIGLGLLDKKYCTDNDSWFLVHESTASTISFNIILTTKIIKSENPFKALYEDKELADFRLIGEDGAEVKIHGAVLAAQSPAVMKMIQERTVYDNIITYSGVKLKTLEDFKTYIYLYVLPTENIEELLLLASRAMMPELKRKCIQNIMTTLSATNVYQLTSFAQLHNIHELYLSILEYIQKGKVKVNDIRNCLNISK